MIEFRVHPHDKYDRDNQNLHTVQTISVLDLLVGTEFDFVTISGKTLRVKVNPKTQPNSKLKLAGEGMPTQFGFGDQYITLKPYIPDIIDQRITDCILQYRQQ